MPLLLLVLALHKDIPRLKTTSHVVDLLEQSPVQPQPVPQVQPNQFVGITLNTVEALAL